MKKTYHIGYKQ